VRLALPHIAAVRNLLHFERHVHLMIVLKKEIFFANDEGDVYMAQVIQKNRIGQAGQEMRRVVEVEGLIVVAVEQVAIGARREGQIVRPLRASTL